jgi:glucose-6-phosphate 1-epimerase
MRKSGQTEGVATDLCTPHTLTAPDGAQLTVCAHGGHVLGWTPAGGRPRLWLSPSTGCGPGLAIRGGIPVIFPQFASRGPLPKHGLARNRGWQVVESYEGSAREGGTREGGTQDGGTREGGDSEGGTRENGTREGGAVLWRAMLSDDVATREIWPHRFELTLTARAEGSRLDTTLTVRNTGDVEWAFTAALHTYLALGDPDALIHGLGGRTAEDNAAAGQPTTLGAAGAALRATTPRDVAVPGVSEPLTLADAVLGPLVLTATGFGDRVVWNPGPGHGLADVPDGAEQSFVCIEAAELTAVMIQPASIWTGRQTLLAKTV